MKHSHARINMPHHRNYERKIRRNKENGTLALLQSMIFDVPNIILRLLRLILGNRQSS